jgi:hypothetical protein
MTRSVNPGRNYTPAQFPPIRFISQGNIYTTLASWNKSRTGTGLSRLSHPNLSLSRDLEGPATRRGWTEEGGAAPADGRQQCNQSSRTCAPLSLLPPQPAAGRPTKLGRGPASMLATPRGAEIRLAASVVSTRSSEACARCSSAGRRSRIKASSSASPRAGQQHARNRESCGY